MSLLGTDLKLVNPWPTAALTALLAFLIPFLIGISPGFDLGQPAYFLLVVPVLALILLVRAFLRRTRRAWLVLCVFCCISVACFKAAYFLRVHGRWMWLASTAKRQVLAQGPPSAGQLRHMDWDGWGMFAQDTEVYLVTDPINATIAVTGSADGLKAKGVPCPFWRSYRLEPHWYAFVFFTNTSWDSCI